MMIKWIAWRLIKEILGDRRTVAFFVLAPVIVMTLVYYAVGEDTDARIGVVTRGMARFFEMDLVNALEDEDNVVVVTLDIDDEETDRAVLEEGIRHSLQSGQVDGILYMEEALLTDRFSGLPGTLYIYVEGSRTLTTASVLEAMSAAMDNLGEALPVVIDASCSAFCADSVNIQAMELERVYLYGSDDYRMIDFFLPVISPFIVFFFTFIIATITFQRERVRGTMERLMVAPMSFVQVFMGYMVGFLGFSGVQAAIILTYALNLMSFPITAGQLAGTILVTLLMMLIGLLLGLFLSFLAHNEFQAIQFVPIIILPQIFVSDMIWNIEKFPLWLRYLSEGMPLTPANRAMRDVIIKNQPVWESWPDLLMLAGWLVGLSVALMLITRRPRAG